MWKSLARKFSSILRSVVKVLSICFYFLFFTLLDFLLAGPWLPLDGAKKVDERLRADPKIRAASFDELTKHEWAECLVFMAIAAGTIAAGVAAVLA